MNTLENWSLPVPLTFTEKVLRRKLEKRSMLHGIRFSRPFPPWRNIFAPSTTIKEEKKDIRTIGNGRRGHFESHPGDESPNRWHGPQWYEIGG